MKDLISRGFVKYPDGEEYTHQEFLEEISRFLDSESEYGDITRQVECYACGWNIAELPKPEIEEITIQMARKYKLLFTCRKKGPCLKFLRDNCHRSRKFEEDLFTTARQVVERGRN